MKGLEKDIEYVIPTSGRSSIPDDLRAMADKVKKLLSLDTIIKDYSATLNLLTAEELRQFYQRTSGSTLFHTIFSTEPAIAQLKLTLLLKKAKELNLNPNQKSLYHDLKNIPDYVNWDNAPIHHYIANEKYDLTKHFLAEAQKQGFEIDLNLLDREGKTPLLLAIKMAKAPIELIRTLITEENYNKADRFGFTPAMMACATSQVEVMKELLLMHARVIGLIKFNVEAPSEEHKKAIADFINQQHPETQKSLAHFALSRGGSDKDYSNNRGPSNQMTLIEITASVGIDGRRDANAKCNAALNDRGGPVVMSQAEILEVKKMTDDSDLKPVYMTGVKNLLGNAIKTIGSNLNTFGQKTIYARMVYHDFGPVSNAMLASWENAFALLIELQGTNKDIHQEIIDQLSSYHKKSHIAVMMAQTKNMVLFLNKIGADFSLQQKNGNKTPKEYLESLKSNADREKSLPAIEKLVTKEDIDCLLPLIPTIDKLEKQLLNKPTSSAENKNSLG